MCPKELCELLFDKFLGNWMFIEKEKSKSGHWSATEASPNKHLLISLTTAIIYMLTTLKVYYINSLITSQKQQPL